LQLQVGTGEHPAARCDNF